MRAKLLPTLKYLEECFNVCDESPSGLVWRIRPKEHFPTLNGWRSANGCYAGKRAGNLWTDRRDRSSQYWSVTILGKTHLAHRIVYSLGHRIELNSNMEIDHIDTVGLNNRISNLRLADSYGNSHNKKISAKNTTGFKGVVWHNGWRAYYGRVTHRWVRHRTQPCPTPEKAAELLRELRETLHKDFTNHG